MIRNLGLVLFVFLLCAACGDKQFDDGAAKYLAQEKPIKLDGEQLVLTGTQVECGAQNDLWEAPSPSGDRSIARLLPKGRSLNFYDDIVAQERGSPSPYAQVRGDFQVELNPPVEIKDGEPGIKMVAAKLGAVIMHSCFTSPLPIMGVRKGQFTADAMPQLRYSQNGKDWLFDRIVH